MTSMKQVNLPDEFNVLLSNLNFQMGDSFHFLGSHLRLIGPKYEIPSQYNPKQSSTHSDLFSHSSDSSHQFSQISLFETTPEGVPRIEKKTIRKLPKKKIMDFHGDQEYIPKLNEETSPNDESDKAEGKTTEIIKNYIPVIANVFCQKMIENNDHEIQNIFLRCMISMNFMEDFKENKEKIMEYIRNEMLGKKSFRTQNGNQRTRQYKIRSKQHINNTLHETPEDGEYTIRIKMIIRMMVHQFLDSSVYLRWVRDEYQTRKQCNREFLAEKRNVDQIKLVFTEKNFRPRFQ